MPEFRSGATVSKAKAAQNYHAALGSSLQKCVWANLPTLTVAPVIRSLDGDIEPQGMIA